VRTLYNVWRAERDELDAHNDVVHGDNDVLYSSNLELHNHSKDCMSWHKLSDKQEHKEHTQLARKLPERNKQERSPMKNWN